jgi:hypothetical protein
VSALAEIRAAIDKLTELRAASTPGSWRTGLLRGDGWVSVDGNWVIGDATNTEDADLIVTLHRTIDPQLAILEVAVAYGDLGEGQGSRFILAATVLARAINGATS